MASHRFRQGMIIRLSRRFPKWIENCADEIAVSPYMDGEATPSDLSKQKGIICGYEILFRFGFPPFGCGFMATIQSCPIAKVLEIFIPTLNRSAKISKL
jgi:hypothetical protein